MKKKKKRIKFFSRGNDKGIITVLVSLLLVPVMLFSGLMVDFARIKMYESQAVFSADLYGNSIMASYNNELYDMYALFGFTANEELEAELAKIASAAYGGDYEVTSQGVEKLVELLSNSYSPNEAVFSPFGSGEVTFSYETAESDGETGTLENNQILRTQITDYTVTRMPTFLVESAIGNGDSEIEQIMQAVDTVKDLDKYSKITSIKTKLDSKLEVFFNLLKAYGDDLYSLKEYNFSDHEKWETYSNRYGEYGIEELNQIIGDNSSGSGYAETSYIGTVYNAYEKIDEYACEIDNLVKSSEECYIYYDEEEEYYYIGVDYYNELKKKLDELKCTIEVEQYDGIVLETSKNLVKVSSDINKLYDRLTNGNAYTDPTSSMYMKKMGRVSGMEKIGEELNRKKADINELIKELYAARREIEDSCSGDAATMETIDEMIGDYSEIQILTSEDVDYEKYAADYVSMIKMINEDSVLGVDYTHTDNDEDGILKKDYLLIEEQFDELKKYCEKAIEFADAQIAELGQANKSDYIKFADPDSNYQTSDEYIVLRSFMNSYAYSTDMYGLFEGSASYTTDDNIIYGPDVSKMKFMSKNYSTVKIVYDTNNLAGNAAKTVSEVCEYIRKSFRTSNVGEKKENTVLKKSKKLLDDMDGVSLDVYEENPLVISDDICSRLAATEAAADKKSRSVSEMLTSIDSFFPEVNVKDLIVNMVVMLYDYNMFSCDTTDKISVFDDNNNVTNKLSDDKSSVYKDGKFDLGEGKDESTALSNLSGESSETSGSSSSGSSGSSEQKSIYYTNKEGNNRDESMTDYCYAETSVLYRCELEYLYAGNKEMQKNLDSARLTIIAERTVFNYLSTYTTKNLNSVIVNIRNAVSAAFTPAVGIVTEGVLRLAIAAIETNSDMTMLLSGASVVLIKSQFEQFSSYEMIKGLLSDMSTDAKASENTGNVSSNSSKFPEIKLNYKQYLLLNIMVFTNKDDLLNRTRDLIDLNVNKKQGNVEIQNNQVILSGDEYFKINDQITVINAKCSVQMSPLFASLGIDKLTEDADNVNAYLTDKRTYSVTKGY